MTKLKWFPFAILIVLMGSLLSCSNASEQATVSNPPQKLIKSDVPLRLVSTTSPIWPGDNITLILQTTPNTDCSASYQYSYWVSGPGGRIRQWSTVNGGECSDDKGNVTVVLETSDGIDPGYYRLNITIGRGSQTDMITSFIVQ